MKVSNRIVTLCMNPALDIATSIPLIGPTHKMRCAAPLYHPGGGGINVARVAGVLGVPATAVFPAGGPAGEAVCNLLTAEGLAMHRVRIGGVTRENFTVNEENTAKQYRFVLPGPHLTVAEQTECLSHLRREVSSAFGDQASAAGPPVVVASGSLPPGVPLDFYQQVANLCDELGATLLLDTSGGGLQNVESGAFLLKPSARELREYANRPLETESEQIAVALGIVARGVARHVLVSIGAGGAVLVSDGRARKFAAVPIPPGGSGVGAGDAMVAGVAVGMLRGWPLERAVRLGIAAGSATLLTPGNAPCTRADTERLFGQAEEPVDVELAPGRR
ncbi:MAG TPA: 1-phosphofructokinase family hexose kinase [Mycobacterium sp.]|mgnify:FL=1|nr:1-phosphofructokinase family hexose kinase [Mycobacterium sp.]